MIFLIKGRGFLVQLFPRQLLLQHHSYPFRQSFLPGKPCFAFNLRQVYFVFCAVILGNFP